MVKYFIPGLLLAMHVFTGQTLQAQDIHNTQFNATPLSVNPAFTGMFNGSVRVTAFYQNQWRSITTPFTSVGTSADLRLMTFKNSSYLGFGTQLIQDQAGDGNLKNFTGTLSAAFHKVFNPGNSDHQSDLAIGVQGGYTQRSVDLSALYFNAMPAPNAPYSLSIGNTVTNYVINTGISFSQAIGKRLNYTAGITCNNMNQPKDALLKKQNESAGLDMALTANIGANWIATNRLTIKPAVIYINRADASTCLAGAEFNYSITGHKNTPKKVPSVFAGGWYNTGSAVTLNAGAAFCGVRVGAAYSYGLNYTNAASNGTGGFEIMARYIARGRKSTSRKPIPCDRF